LTAPTNLRDLLARVKKILCREESNIPAEPDDLLRLGDLCIDTTTREVWLHGTLLELFAQEYEVLLALVCHPGQVFSRERLLRAAWKSNLTDHTRTVDMYIAHLRKKLATSVLHIETVQGYGYRLVAS